MKIAIDIDEILFEFAEGYFEFARRKGLVKISFEDITTYNFWELLNIGREEAVNISDHFFLSNLSNQGRVVSGARDSLKKLRNHEIFFVTNRPKRWKEKTFEFIENDLDFRNPRVFFSGDFHKDQSKTKKEICSDLDVDLIIEDQGPLCLDCAEGGLRVLLLDKPWNKDVEHKNITRCRSWAEILKEIEEIERKNEE